MTYEELTATLNSLFGEAPWPKPFHLLKGLQLVAAGVPFREAARSVGTTEGHLREAFVSPDPVASALGLRLDEVDTAHRQQAAQIVGQLLLGRCAELAFEEIYKSEMHAEEFELRDLREGRTDTDYRLYNGRGRPVYRINIKFHGSPFRRAPDLVDLQPEDCFALATYKIHSALQKQQDEGLPYFFAVVGVPNLTGETVGRTVPSYLVETVALVDQAPRGRSRRDFEDAAVAFLVRTRHPLFEQTFDRIVQADWYVVSAKRAERLLREMLFQRVFALRVRSFTRAFRGAELDMHFSLSTDLIPLRRFLSTLRQDGPQRITTLMARGDY